MFAGGRQQACRCCWVSSSVTGATAVLESSPGREAEEDWRQFLEWEHGWSDELFTPDLSGRPGVLWKLHGYKSTIVSLRVHYFSLCDQGHVDWVLSRQVCRAWAIGPGPQITSFHFLASAKIDSGAEDRTHRHGLCPGVLSRAPPCLVPHGPSLTLSRSAKCSKTFGCVV